MATTLGRSTTSRGYNGSRGTTTSRGINGTSAINSITAGVKKKPDEAMDPLLGNVAPTLPTKKNTSGLKTVDVRPENLKPIAHEQADDVPPSDLLGSATDPAVAEAAERERQRKLRLQSIRAEAKPTTILGV